MKTEITERKYTVGGTILTVSSNARIDASLLEISAERPEGAAGSTEREILGPTGFTNEELDALIAMLFAARDDFFRVKRT